MDDATLDVTDTDHGLRDRLSAEIIAFNEAATGYTDGQLLCITARGADGELRGGLYGWTWGGCGYIDLLWVTEDQRRTGLGSQLLAAAEQETRRRGCDRVALSTHSFQAPGFYARFGYAECGRIPAYPHGHDQIQLVKHLT
jgi:GNAT superfamily N-acetyltransferase